VASPIPIGHLLLLWEAKLARKGGKDDVVPDEGEGVAGNRYGPYPGASLLASALPTAGFARPTELLGED